MTPTNQLRNVTGSADGVGAVHLLLAQGEGQWMAEDPELVMADLQRRAEEVSSLLEGILLEPHGIPRWGINE
jgi:hypothetical protein